MGWGWVVGLAVAALAVVAVLRLMCGTPYRRLFGDENFLEVARGVGRLKATALEKAAAQNELEVTCPDDPRVLITAAGLVLLYTIRRVDDRFVHHYSVSVAGRYTAHAVGETFVLFVAKLLGIPFESMALGVAQSTVHHAEFELSAVEQSEFAARSVAESSLAAIKAFRGEWADARKHLAWQRLPTDPAYPSAAAEPAQAAPR